MVLLFLISLIIRERCGDYSRHDSNVRQSSRAAMWEAEWSGMGADDTNRASGSAQAQCVYTPRDAPRVACKTWGEHPMQWTIGCLQKYTVTSVCLFLRFSWAWKGNKYSAGTLATFLDAPPCHTTTPHPHHVVAVSQCRAVPVAVSLFRCVARPWRKDVKKAYREACSTTIPMLYNWYVVNSWRNPSITNATAAHSTLTMNHHKSMPTRHKQTNKTITSNPWLWFERNLVLMLVTSFTKFSFYNIYIYIHIYINTHTHTHYK